MLKILAFSSVSAVLSISAALAQSVEFSVPEACRQEFAAYSSTARSRLPLIRQISASDAHLQQAAFNLEFFGGREFRIVGSRTLREVAHPGPLSHELRLQMIAAAVELRTIEREIFEFQAAMRASGREFQFGGRTFTRRQARPELRRLENMRDRLLHEVNPEIADSTAGGRRRSAPALDVVSQMISDDLNTIARRCQTGQPRARMISASGQLDGRIVCPDFVRRTYSIDQIYTGASSVSVRANAPEIEVCHERRLELLHLSSESSLAIDGRFSEDVVLQTCSAFSLADARTQSSTVDPVRVTRTIRLAHVSHGVPLLTNAPEVTQLQAVMLSQASRECQEAFTEANFRPREESRGRRRR